MATGTAICSCAAGGSHRGHAARLAGLRTDPGAGRMSHHRGPSSFDRQRARRAWDRAARAYDPTILLLERALLGDGRGWLGGRATGDVLEVAIGTGRNARHFAPAVRLAGVDISPRMLARARRRALALGRKADLHIGDAEALEFADASFDTVVFSLALCSIRDDRAAVHEAMRVLRPGGRLLLLEHVRSPHRLVRVLQAGLESLTVRSLGDHQLRDPLAHVLDAGFELVAAERSRLGIVERVEARKPVPSRVGPEDAEGGFEG